MRGEYLSDLKPERRDRMEIVAQILEITKDRAAKTQIMYGANLSFAQLNKYLPLMKLDRLIAGTSLANKTIYSITFKGLDFLERYNELVKMLEPPATILK